MSSCTGSNLCLVLKNAELCVRAYIKILPWAPLLPTNTTINTTPTACTTSITSTTMSTTTTLQANSVQSAGGFFHHTLYNGAGMEPACPLVLGVFQVWLESI